MLQEQPERILCLERPGGLVSQMPQEGGVSPLDEQLNQRSGAVCDEHNAQMEELEVMADSVQQDSTCRSMVGHPSTDEAGQEMLLRQECPVLKRQLPSW